jgi:site-specific recombinase XerD
MTQHAIVPIERLTLPVTLDGTQGSNRAMSRQPKIAASNDLEAIMAWYGRFRDKKNTFESYRREGERLLLWSIKTLGKPLSSLSHEDFQHYEEFLKNPTPEDVWIAKTKHHRENPEWRPFFGPLTTSSIRHTMGVINNLMSWLVEAQYLAGNPLTLQRKKRGKKNPTRLTRFLYTDQWEAVLRYVETMPRESDRDIEHYERSRWISRLFYLAGMRISEVAENSMGCFQRFRDSKGVYRWNLVITGKGDKERAIPVGEDLLEALTRYRRSVGLPAFPTAGEATPLVVSLRNKEMREGIKRQALDKSIKSIFEGTADMLELSEDEHERNSGMILRYASAHWIRHSAGSHMANAGVQLTRVRDFLGHDNIQTTSIYLHTENEEFHDEVSRLHRLPGQQ